MANSGGMIYESIWRDQDWRKLSIRAQRRYMQLLSQKELDCAGMLPLQPEKWATGCDEDSTAQVWEDLDELQAARFVFYDTNTYETLVRSYIRNSNVLKVPNMWKSARRCAKLAASPVLRSVLADEFAASGNESLISAAKELNPSLTLPEPLPNPSGRVPEGCGVGVGVGVTHLSSTKGGEKSRPVCSKHPNGNPDDEPCRGCMKVREYDEKQAEAAEADELDERRRLKELRDNCPMCRGTNWIEVSERSVIKCDHRSALKEVSEGK